MVDKKISQLPLTTPGAGDEIAAARGGTTYKIDIVEFGIPFAVVIPNGSNQVLDAADASAVRSVEWVITLYNGTNVQHSRVIGVTDLTDVEYSQSSIIEMGTGFPPIHVDLSAGDLRLLADTTGTGWTAVVRRYAYAA